MNYWAAKNITSPNFTNFAIEINDINWKGLEKNISIISHDICSIVVIYENFPHSNQACN